MLAEMSALLLVGWLAVAVRGAFAATLSDVCTISYVKSVLPSTGFLQGVTILADSLTVNAVTNYSMSSSGPGLAARAASQGYSLCNVTFAYTHDGLNDTTNVWYWFPSPDQFSNRFLATGGGGFSITSGQSGLAAGLKYGAATGTTDAGLGGWSAQLTDVVLASNGTLNYEAIHMFSYKAIHEMTVLGKELARKFYGANSSKVYAYYSGCSEGGRDGLSQVQRYGSQFDGAAIGAPALRMASQQVIHLFSALVEITRSYYPSSCEMARINNDTIASCDLLDGKEDGVVSRTDLCKLHYNATSAIGKSYSCSASSGGARGGGGRGPGGGVSSASPAASGNVTAAAVVVAADIWRGLFDSEDRQAYISFQPSADFSDAATVYNNATRRYEAAVSGIGVQWVNYFLKETKSSQLSLANVTYDTLREWILEGMQKYADTLQTNWPDLGEFRANGGKIIHYHGESDPSIPSGSSVLYHDAVRRTMYPDLSFNESYAALNGWYRFFLVPGAGHCGRSSDQPNGPFPADVLGSVIAWVEQDKEPSRLNATVPSGASQSICTWPLRPYWNNSNASDPDCVFDQPSVDSWLPKLDSIPVPVW